jgi:hypothetical protein
VDPLPREHDYFDCVLAVYQRFLERTRDAVVYCKRMLKTAQQRQHPDTCEGSGGTDLDVLFIEYSEIRHPREAPPAPHKPQPPTESQCLTLLQNSCLFPCQSWYRVAREARTAAPVGCEEPSIYPSYRRSA